MTASTVIAAPAAKSAAAKVARKLSTPSPVAAQDWKVSDDTSCSRVVVPSLAMIRTAATGRPLRAKGCVTTRLTENAAPVTAKWSGSSQQACGCG
jgi:hypothetical protein